MTTGSSELNGTWLSSWSHYANAMRLGLSPKISLHSGVILAPEIADVYSPPRGIRSPPTAVRLCGFAHDTFQLPECVIFVGSFSEGLQRSYARLTIRDSCRRVNSVDSRTSKWRMLGKLRLISKSPSVEQLTEDASAMRDLESRISEDCFDI
jgi:hypothetical protein